MILPPLDDRRQGAAILAVCLLALAGCGDTAKSHVEKAAGGHASCERIGYLAVAGKREPLWGCHDSRNDTSRGCYVVIDGQPQDVSAEVESLADLSGQVSDC